MTAVEEIGPRPKALALVRTDGYIASRKTPPPPGPMTIRHHLRGELKTGYGDLKALKAPYVP